MIVEVIGGADQIPEVTVVDVDDLTALHLALGEVTDDEADRALRGAGLGRLVDAATGLLNVEELQAAASPRAAAPDWAEGFAAMLERARGEGWLSADGASLRVHLESAAGA